MGHPFTSSYFQFFFLNVIIYVDYILHNTLNFIHKSMDTLVSIKIYSLSCLVICTLVTLTIYSLLIHYLQISFYPSGTLHEYACRRMLFTHQFGLNCLQNFQC